eukprot:Plantae.Rhodophyta-Purpureofilum_apyrenoidigerum.ctg18542.p1 GENE.Plantae.Rhodophyta-Purpureofilum_apyrenoidigerum.ctg18542~~Plantae.Rhodophyta-Purpureofilum_apyrenoidigerum.ctg18542.p1  ORF type:complete len:275 (-),score=36.61 Plantae.Rhodophyta-Purpureofilum_apyrenoidigerum.ctg18542:251-1075(-)
MLETMEHLLSFGKDWRFTPGETALSNAFGPVTTVLSYFLLIYFLQVWMASKPKPYEFKYVLVAHNAFLCIASSLLFLWLGAVLILKAFNVKGDIDWMICSAEMHDDGRLHLIYYINHLTKYYELLDTVLLVLRQKPVLFLHEYHHGATLLLTWSQLREHSTVQWVPIFINLGVHIIMYYYYAMAALKIRVWWKKYLTALQIVQFVIGVTACVYCYGKYLLANFDYSKQPRCNGTDVGAITGIAILMSYLILFVQFYFQTYKTNDRRIRSQKKLE